VGLADGDRRVRISGAQAAGCAPVATALAAGEAVPTPVRPDTIAKSLAIGSPADGEAALRAVRASSGSIATATDAEIIEAIRLLARTEGIFAETAGGVTIASLAKLAQSGVVRHDERVVACITGTGLKTIEAFGDTLGPSAVIEPSFGAFTALEESWRNPK
jgi:threonine synthase